MMTTMLIMVIMIMVLMMTMMMENDDDEYELDECKILIINKHGVLMKTDLTKISWRWFLGDGKLPNPMELVIWEVI